MSFACTRSRTLSRAQAAPFYAPLGTHAQRHCVSECAHNGFLFAKVGGTNDGGSPLPLLEICCCCCTTSASATAAKFTTPTAGSPGQCLQLHQQQTTITKTQHQQQHQQHPESSSSLHNRVTRWTLMSSLTVRPQPHPHPRTHILVQINGSVPMCTWWLLVSGWCMCSGVFVCVCVCACVCVCGRGGY
jgi:hypothetical protein